MKLHQLRALVAVSNAGSIQEASRLMHLTQPALSKSILELEREMGVSLLERSAKGATLTPYGATVVKRSRAIQKEIARMLEEVDSLRGGLGGRLSIGLTPPAADAPLAEAIAAFQRRRPTVELHLMELRPLQISQGLHNGSLDLGLISQADDPPAGASHWELLYSLSVILTANGKYPKGNFSLKSLLQENWLMLDARDDTSNYVAALFSRANLPVPTKKVYCSSIVLYLELATRMDLIAHWSDSASSVLEKHFQNGTLTRLEPPVPLPELKTFLGYQDENLLTPVAQEFVALLYTEVSKLREMDRAR
jgi:LysR family transcriptional regulator of abg operon